MRPLPPLPADDLAPRQQVFLGRDPADGHKRVWSSQSDSVGIIGPPRYGKTAGLIIPSLLYWDGPVVCTSTRGDLLRATGDRRRHLARPGGRVHLYDPLGTEALGTMRWSPVADCADPAVCYRRVQTMTAAAANGVTDATHWRSGAALILRGLLHAAALANAPLSEVRRWIARQEVRRPADLIRSHHGTDAWADDLESLPLLGDRERGSFYSVARGCLEATAEPTVLASCDQVDLDIDTFLDTNSTLFVVSPSHIQEAIAPLIVALVDAIAQRAAERAALAGGRLNQPLLLALDEVANIAPLESLPALVSEGGGRGIITLWSTQSLAYLRARYGTDRTQGILTSTTAKVTYGGLSSDTDLRNISSWAGEARTPEITHHSPGIDPVTGMPDRMRLGNPDQLAGQHSVSGTYRPVMPLDALQQMPPGHAWLWWQSSPPLHVETRPAHLVPAYQPVSGYTPERP
ncbi:type IV secretory pathway TraG/TraD family ATPase VirD4 [Nocardiopsis arvandica]|uniref:Type IV secretory pathway TraG/TraD family ATPase VirD4 n=1 Tax=Nocardiopsis sinuspersici TaxID=501010 RepID=A0A7Z0BN76_9ACTN|nr:type IV secretory system conjugative DNA transfer family protein [Nocardiopsis sinuspersici]NYH55292.1 type IV secretory pathway TraG/TraD family ATPase VirD4 [Nocardiopsis sinuspersici]